MDNPGVAVIGAGYWGKNVVRALGALGALRTVCDPDGSRLKECGEAFPGVRLCAGYGDALRDGGVTAVAVAAPAALHAEIVSKALEAGKDVFVEKPLCLSAGEGERLVERAAALGRVLMVGHLLHYHGAVRKLKEMV